MGGGLNNKKLDGTWPHWLRENLDRQCDPEKLLEILLKNGFGLASIQEHMGLRFPLGSPLLKNLNDQPQTLGIDYPAIAQTRITRLDSGLNVQQVLNEKIQLFILDNFLSDRECDRVIEIANQHLRPSTVTTDDNQGYRTSSTSDLALLNHNYIQAIDEKIARTVGITLSYGEGIQAQRYEVGQQFKQHTDYFDPGTEAYRTHATQRGQRTWTFMVYLNGEMRGGGTQFLGINQIFYPQTGRAIVWNNLLPDGQPNPNTLHSGLPVEEGHKIIITKWFREKGSGPMFYSDAADL
jgi:prolyl 4-hydroxylase